MMKLSFLRPFPVSTKWALCLFILSRIFHDVLQAHFNHYAEPNYLSLHIVLEFFSIAVSIGIAYQGWLIHPYISSRYRLWLGALFLAVGLLDLAHTLTFKGMPYFFAESSTTKATWYWILARLTEALGLLFIFRKEDCDLQEQEKVTPFLLGLVWSNLVIFIVFQYYQVFPPLLLEKTGLTPLKISLEYLINGLHLVTIYFLLLRSQREDSQSYQFLLSALVFMLLGEQVFTSYVTPYDFDNCLGHIFKVIGYTYLLQGIYTVTVEEPLKRREEAQNQLKLTATVFNNSLEGIIILDGNGNILTANPAFTTITGYEYKEVVGRKLEFLRSKQHRPEFYEKIWTTLLETGKWQGEIWSRRKNNSIFAEWLTISAVKDSSGKKKQFVGIFSDITSRKEYELQIKHQAYHDALTGLPNRAMLYQQIEDWTDNHTPFALFFMDIDGFKSINDQYGHDEGDHLLQHISRRLEFFVSETALLSRWGGDEFIILLPAPNPRQAASILAEKIIDSFAQSFHLETNQIHVTTSIGVSISPLHGTSPEELLKKADQAMYQAKESGKNQYVLYE